MGMCSGECFSLAWVDGTTGKGRGTCSVVSGQGKTFWYFIMRNHLQTKVPFSFLKNYSKEFSFLLWLLIKALGTKCILSFKIMPISSFETHLSRVCSLMSGSSVGLLSRQVFTYSTSKITGKMWTFSSKKKFQTWPCAVLIAMSSLMDLKCLCADSCVGAEHGFVLLNSISA